MLDRIVERMARLSPPRHRQLVRGMLAELDSIVDPAERARFALGAIVAITRLMLSSRGRATVDASGRLIDLEAPAEAPPMSKLTSRQLLLRHATPFAVSLASLTVLLLTTDATRWTSQLSARGAPGGAIVEVLVLALPHTLALTIPMSVLLAVSWVFAQLGREGVLASARRERRGIRRLVTPVLAAATVVAAFASVSNTEVLPRANARFVAVLDGAPREPTDRTMTIGELRAAAERVRATTGTDAAARATAYEVEIHKKFAVGAASVVLALIGVAIAIRFPYGGSKVALGASVLVFIGYWLLLVGGEELADRQLLSPLVAMWMANALLVAVALLLVPPPRRHDPMDGAETLAIHG